MISNIQLCINVIAAAAAVAIGPLRTEAVLGRSVGCLIGEGTMSVFNMWSLEKNRWDTVTECEG